MKNTENLIKRLKAQIAVAREIDSDWAYITIGDAKKILKLLENNKDKEVEVHEQALLFRDRAGT